MKSKHRTGVVGLAVAVGIVIAWALLPKHQAAPAAVAAAQLATVATPEFPAAPKISASTKIEPPTAESLVLAEAVASNNGVKPTGTTPVEPPITVNGYELEDPMARVALNSVGADPEADAYWIGAINDFSLPAEERKDLIEDLNEEGLSNPRHPAAQDLPLILSRIRLIEQLMPSALDQVNRDALAEAYKDLVDLANGNEPQ